MRHGILDPGLSRWLLKKRDPWICRSSLLVPFYVNLLPDISGLCSKHFPLVSSQLLSPEQSSVVA